MAEAAKNSGRDLFGQTLAECGDLNKDIVVLAVDALWSTKEGDFYQRNPDRTFNFGIAEANMVAAAAGFAITGKIPVMAQFGFLTMRTAEQIRTDLCYDNLNAKVFATAVGLSMGTGGVTHWALEDIAFTRAMPNITILSPGSPAETVKATKAAILDIKGPVYVRLVRGDFFGGSEEFYDKDVPFVVGKGITIKDGKDVTIVSTGQPVAMALQAAQALEKEGISARVINIHTIKPLDVDILKKAAQETKGIVTVEEHNIEGGLGDAVCAAVCATVPTKVKKIGIGDYFLNNVGPTSSLWEQYGLTKENVMKAAKDLLKK